MVDSMADARPVLSLGTPSARNAPRAPMAETGPAPRPGASLRILHVLRAPVGGAFRHVLDLARGQIERGHKVGLIVDSTTGGAPAAALLGELAPHLALGLERVPMARQLSPRDAKTLPVIATRVKRLAPHVLHGHGAKGGALARLTPGAANAIRVYTPHGGSLGYSPGTLVGGFYRKLEWLLSRRTDLFLFESSYMAGLFRREIGSPPHAMIRIARNGVAEAEFAPIALAPDATDLVFVGELRQLKGIDLLIEALAFLKRNGRRVSATIAGEGPDGAELKAQALRLEVADQVGFIGYCPAREAFAMGRTLVMPSRSESLPYIILEAAAAAVPIIATRVGGIPDIFGPQADALVPPDDVEALAGAVAAALDDPKRLSGIARAVQARVRGQFSLAAMIEEVLAAYRDAMAMRKLAQFA